MKEKKQYFYSRMSDVMLFYISLPILHNVDTLCAVVGRQRLLYLKQIAAQDSDRWQAFVNAVLNLQGLKTAGYFLTS